MEFNNYLTSYYV